MQNVIVVTDATFMTDVIEQSRTVPVLVDFWADWCEPCKALGPILDKLAEEYDGAFLLAKADTEQAAQVAAALRVQSIPAVYLFVDGQPVDAFTGALPESDIRAFLGRHCQAPADDLARAGDVLVQDGGEDAEKAFLEALAADPKQPAALLGLSRLLTCRGEIDGARDRLEAIGLNAPEGRAAKRLQDALDFWALGAGMDDSIPAPETGEPAPEIDARLVEAARLGRTRGFEQAVSLLYEAVGEDREYRNQMARRAMISLFGFLGEDSDVVRGWQRRLASLLY
jgi:putative thioredoxin